MAFYLVVAGGTLYKLSTNGTALALDLPADVTLSPTRPPRFAIVGRHVLVVNNPTRSLWVDPTFRVRPMQLVAPVGPPVLSAGAAGALTGAYRVKYTHIVKDPLTGALLAESDFSPESAPVDLAAQRLLASGVTVSPDQCVTHRRLYRTLAEGAVYYPWLDLDGNTLTVVEDDLTDDLLPNLAATRELGVGPGLLPGTYMTLCVEWKGRLWGVGNRNIDTLRYSGLNQFYGWPATYGLDIKPIGGDAIGISGLIARKHLLGVSKRGVFWKVSGGQPDEDGIPQWDTDLERDGKGIRGPDTAQVIDDIGYYLADDGVYSWGPEGFQCRSDGKTRKWFTTDDYFNRTMFPQAFANYNETYDTYELHLAAAGSDVIDRWVSLDRKTGAWHGPHKTDKATPTCVFTIEDAGNRKIPVIGAADAVIYKQNQPGWSDAGVAIALNLQSKWHDGNTPTIEKVFGPLAVVLKKIAAVGRCLVAYRVGAIDGPVTQTVALDLRMAHQTLPRVGKGVVVQLEITEDTNGIACELHGYELPFYELGDRAPR